MRWTFALLGALGTAAFAGILLAIGVISGGLWQELTPAAFLDQFAATSPHIKKAIPLALGPAAVGIIGSILLSRERRDLRLLWIGAAAAMTLLLLLTATVHLPLNSAFETRSLALADVPASLDTWILSHGARTGLALAAAMFALIALSRHERKPDA